MADFTVRRDPEGVLHLVGDLDMASAEVFLGQAVERLDGAREIVLDLAGLTFIDSTGIRAFLTPASRVDGPVVVRHAQPNVARVLEIVRLDGVRGIRVRP
jgi:anti-sigma B factor antagonist